MSTTDLVTKIPRTECERRLHQAVASEWSLVSASGVVGSVGADAIRLHKRIYYRNSFQQYLHGKLSDCADGGTRIHCEFRELPLLPFVILAGVIALIAAGATLFMAVSHSAQLQAVPLAAMLAPLAVIPLLAIVGSLAVFIGRWAARGDRQFLLDFLRRTLDASDSR